MLLILSKRYASEKLVKPFIRKVTEPVKKTTKLYAQMTPSYNNNRFKFTEFHFNHEDLKRSL
jgi:hypothetical protein